MLATMYGQYYYLYSLRVDATFDANFQTFQTAVFLVFVGSEVAGNQSFDIDAIGFILIWGYNIPQIIFGLDLGPRYKHDGIFSAKKFVTVFDINFCFALIAFAYSAVMSLVFSNEFSLLVKKMFEMDFSFFF